MALEQEQARHGARPLNIAKKVILVFTDGWGNKGPDPESVSKQAKSAGYTIYSVGYEVGQFFKELTIMQLLITE